MRIHVTREIAPQALQRLLDTGWDIFVGPQEVPSRQRFLWAVGGSVGVIVVPTELFDAEAFERCPDLRVISVCSETLDNVDLDEAQRRGVLVYRAEKEPRAETAVENLIAALQGRARPDTP